MESMAVGALHIVKEKEISLDRLSVPKLTPMVLELAKRVAEEATRDLRHTVEVVFGAFRVENAANMEKRASFLYGHDEGDTYKITPTWQQKRNPPPEKVLRWYHHTSHFQSVSSSGRESTLRHAAKDSPALSKSDSGPR